MIRTIIWFIWFVLSLLISLPFSLRVKYLIKKNKIEESEALIYKCTNIWAKSLLKLAGVKINVHGIENIPKDKTVLFVGNHQGNFDIPIYMTQMPRVIGFISKIEVEKIPVVKTWMTFMHCVFMDRSNLRKSSESIIKGISFKLATKSKSPIVPVTIDGSYKIMEHGNGPWIKPAIVNLYIHPAIETASLNREEQEELHKKVQDIISSKLS